MIKQSSVTNPGQESENWDCPGDSRTVDNYESIVQYFLHYGGTPICTVSWRNHTAKD